MMPDIMPVNIMQTEKENVTLITLVRIERYTITSMIKVIVYIFGITIG